MEDIFYSDDSMDLADCSNDSNSVPKNNLSTEPTNQLNLEKANNISINRAMINDNSHSVTLSSKASDQIKIRYVLHQSQMQELKVKHADEVKNLKGIITSQYAENTYHITRIRSLTNQLAVVNSQLRVLTASQVPDQKPKQVPVIRSTPVISRVLTPEGTGQPTISARVQPGISGTDLPVCYQPRTSRLSPESGPVDSNCTPATLPVTWLRVRSEFGSLGESLLVLP